MVSAKQKAARAKFAAIMRSGGFKKHKTARHRVKHVKTRGVSMARRGRSRRRSSGGGMGGMGGMLKPILYGAIGGIAAPHVPVVNTLPFSSAIGGAGAAYLLGGKSTKNMLIGAAAGYFIPSLLGMGGTATQTAGQVNTGTSRVYS